MEATNMEEFLRKDSNIFFLNNLLMSVQFFKNFDRDVEVLRQNWFEESSIENQNKKCFSADSLFKVIGRNVKFSPRHGEDKNLVSQLHPLRMYISSDNVEAAYDPSALKSLESNGQRQYQFTVKPAESEKSGCITLVEFNRRRSVNKNRRPQTLPSGFNDTFSSEEITQENSQSKSIHLQKRYNFDERRSRRLTKTESTRSVLFNREIKPKKSVRMSFLRILPSAEGEIPVNGFYKFKDPETGLKIDTIQEFRMNSASTASHEIPIQCFQAEEVRRKINSRRAVLGECFRSQRVLNSAAFEAHFCDLLVDQLAGALHLDSEALNESTVSDEFIIVNQTGTQFHITPMIPVRDWNDFVQMNKKFRAVGKKEQVVWPSHYMQKIINLLPCNAVPSARSQWEENLENQKTWTLIFPKAEEFLLLHMMHAHVRCYLFALLLYKSFIEKEINGASFGPKHLMHLLFWRVHKNFFAWPEDRPAETLLNFLKVLYKKLQNKSLCDFFITSRNLFASSPAKDLHKVQALIKNILENPLVYIGRAVRNLHVEPEFYPVPDVLELIHVVNTVNAPATSKGVRKEKKKRVRIQEDEEQLWKKIAIRQMERERKLEEQEQLSRLSKESIQVQDTSKSEPRDLRTCNRLLEIFTSHFVQMGIKSLEYDCASQALLYLNQTEKLFELMLNNDIDQNMINPSAKKINELRESCYSKLKKDFPRVSSKRFQASSEKPLKNFREEEERKGEDHTNQQSKGTTRYHEDEGVFDEDNQIITVKL